MRCCECSNMSKVVRDCVVLEISCSMVLQGWINQWKHYMRIVDHIRCRRWPNQGLNRVYISLVLLVSSKKLKNTGFMAVRNFYLKQNVWKWIIYETKSFNQQNRSSLNIVHSFPKDGAACIWLDEKRVRLIRINNN